MTLWASFVPALVCLVVASSVFACDRDARPSEPLAGVRLGMSPRDVRDRFEESSLGEWQATLGRGDDTLLEWTSRRPTTRLSHARFEFHLGMLVAIRAHVREAIGREQAEVTTKTVTVRKPAEGGTDLVMVARDCPTHREEAETLVERARR